MPRRAVPSGILSSPNERENNVADHHLLLKRSYFTDWNIIEMPQPMRFGSLWHTFGGPVRAVFKSIKLKAGIKIGRPPNMDSIKDALVALEVI
jgi:hypothetical protein